MGDKGINNTKDIHIKWLELMRFKRSIITIVAIIMLWNIRYELSYLQSNNL